MLLRVLGLASGVCLALGPEFPEVAHRGPSIVGLGGRIPIRGVSYIVVVCVCVCVCQGIAWVPFLVNPVDLTCGLLQKEQDHSPPFVMRIFFVCTMGFKWEYTRIYGQQLG